jgi:hypothetical protein
MPEVWGADLKLKALGPKAVWTKHHRTPLNASFVILQGKE